MTLIVEADDFGAMGAATDKILSDPEGQAFMASRTPVAIRYRWSWLVLGGRSALTYSSQR